MIWNDFVHQYFQGLANSSITHIMEVKVCFTYKYTFHICFGGSFTLMSVRSSTTMGVTIYSGARCRTADGQFGPDILQLDFNKLHSSPAGQRISNELYSWALRFPAHMDSLNLPVSCMPLRGLTDRSTDVAARGQLARSTHKVCLQLYTIASQEIHHFSNYDERKSWLWKP